MTGFKEATARWAGPTHAPPDRAKLFTHGGSQAVRLPKAFRFEGKEVSIRKEGDRVILEPVEIDWNAFWARIDSRKTGGPEDDWELPPDPPLEEDKDLSW